MLKDTNQRAKIYVIGAGLAGLSTATKFVEQGREVAVFEASLQAGGRCRSFDDQKTGCRIDNGNHLFLNGNPAIHRYLERVSALDRIAGEDRACLRFVDIQGEGRWQLDAGCGRFPWPLVFPANRPRGLSLMDLICSKKRMLDNPDQTIASLFSDKPDGYRNFWEPLCRSVLNTPPHLAVARSLAQVFVELGKTGAFEAIPKTAKENLGNTFIEPAIDYLETCAEPVMYGARVQSLEFYEERVKSIVFSDRHIQVHKGEQVVLAVPPWIAQKLVPGLSAPGAFFGILNGHFMLPREFQKLKIIGVINGTSEWIFAKNAMASVTISAVDENQTSETRLLANTMWQEICSVLSLGELPIPAHRIVHEKRATIAHTASQERLRPDTRTRYLNLFLAGDWVQTGLPCTIEGAIRSGEMAVQAATER